MSPIQGWCQSAVRKSVKFPYESTQIFRNSEVFVNTSFALPGWRAMFLFWRIVIGSLRRRRGLACMPLHATRLRTCVRQKNYWFGNRLEQDIQVIKKGHRRQIVWPTKTDEVVWHRTRGLTTKGASSTDRVAGCLYLVFGLLGQTTPASQPGKQPRKTRRTCMCHEAHDSSSSKLITWTMAEHNRTRFVVHNQSISFLWFS